MTGIAAFVQEHVTPHVEDHVFGKAEFALHELAHWFTLGCPQLRDTPLWENRFPLADYINTLPEEDQLENEIDTLAVVVRVLHSHCKSTFGVHHVYDPLETGYTETPEGERLSRGGNLKTYFRRKKSFIRKVLSRASEQHIIAIADNICTALSREHQ